MCLVGVSCLSMIRKVCESVLVNLMCVLGVVIVLLMSGFGSYGLMYVL